MKPKNTHLAALTCTAFLGSAALSQAATVIFADDFNTADGFVSLQGTSGGATSTGFNGNWYDAGNGTDIYSSGGAGGMALGIATAKRNLTSTIGESGTYLMQFDMFFTDDTNVAVTGASEKWGTFSFFNGPTEIIAFNNTWQSNTWGSAGPGVTVTVNNAVTNVSTTFQTAYIELTLGVGATDSAKMWINTTQGGGYDPLSTPDVVSSGFDLNGVSTIRIGGTAENRVDNISLTVIPEPSSLLLGGLGLLALLRRRR